MKRGLEKAIEIFNKHYPVGTKVIFRDWCGNFIDDEILHPAWILSDKEGKYGVVQLKEYGLRGLDEVK